MALSNATLSVDSVLPALLLFVDFADLPIRAAMAPLPLTVPGGLADGDADCWGYTFGQLDNDVLEISPVEQGPGGSGTLRFTFMADAATPALLNAIENQALYLHRRIRLWKAIFGFDGQVVEIEPLTRVYMTVPTQSADGTSFLIGMEAENFGAVAGGGQGRTYLNSTKWDAGDTSGTVSRGQTAAPGVIGGGGREFGMNEWVRQQ